MLVEGGGRQDIPVLSDRFQLEADELLPILDAASLLGFADVKEGDVCITEIGRTFAEGDIQSSKEIFKKQALAAVPLVNRIYRTLQTEPKGTIRASIFLEILEAEYTEGEAERQLSIAVDWGRYAELFEYDVHDGVLRLSS